MATPNIQYVANLNAQQVFNQLNQINVQINNVTNQANQGFSNLGSSVGVTAGIVGSLTTAFIQLGMEGIRTLEEIISRSVETAIQIDTLKARLGGIFDGSKEAADEAFTFIQDKSKELGIDLSELAGAFLPKTESLAQFERVAKIATALARSDPEQGAIGARIALIEALSGTFTSLQRRFEIPKEDINRIKEAFDKEGIEGFLSTLETVLDESGKSFEDLANTAQTTFDRLGIAGEQLGGRLGTPIVEALETAANKILDFINANEDDLIIFADTIGRAIADVINLISNIDLGQLDTQGLIEFADYLRRILEAAQLLAVQLSGLGPLFSGLMNSVAPVGQVFEYLAYVLSNIDDALYTAAQAAAIVKASYAGLTASLEPLIDVLGNLLMAAGQAAAFDYGGALKSLENAALSIQNSTESQAAFNASIMESQAAFKAYDDAVASNKEEQDKLRDSLEAQRQAGTDAADSILSNAMAQRQAAEDAEKLAEAQAKVDKAMADAKKDFDRKMEDIDRNFERKRLDIAIEFAQKREDAAEKNLEKLSDIRRKYSQDVTDAETDLNREEEDIARKFGQERLDLEKETRQKRLDIEINYRRSLQDIQAQFLLDADEAEKKRDAIAFLRAVKERDTKVQQAQTNRQREIEDTRITQEQKREELRVQQQRELEEARLANERKLEDLRLALGRQIEEQNIAYARELEDLQEQETRKLEEAQRARERDREDAKLAYDRKLEDLQESLAEELEILKAGNAALEEEAKRHAQTMADAQAAVEAAGGPISQDSAFVRNRMELDKAFDKIKNRERAQGRTTLLGGRARGGFVAAKGSYLVGENGAEVFTPATSGMITPNKNFIMATPASSSIANYSRSSRQEINLPMATAGQLLDPIFIAQLRNIIRTELGKLYG